MRPTKMKFKNDCGNEEKLHRLRLLQMKHQDIMRREKEKMARLEHINILRKGDLFGEIAMLTSLKRTCTVKARSYMMVQTLSIKSLKKIEFNAPNVYNEL
jgi:CRP-like cAMP-binding protein